ncbi:TPR domain protein [Panicum miliaceum]|uniref:TPR domain protein n=1 Tax=Panicum miliaceum TaxID=4540 RepID=A0A3L6TS38_PANMI|nr:TPR domain protein [Panicum miliaceum]
MEAATATSSPGLTRSASLSAARLRRSPDARFPPSPQLCPLSAAASPRALVPLRRARSDADLASVARSAVLLRHAPIPAILEADEKEDGRSPAGLDRLLDGAGAGRNGVGGGQGGGGGANGGSGGQGSGCDMGEYYRRVLLLDPANPLLLRNYGKYLHEVEGDLAGAEGCYARAMLACPGDADLLSLYGRVIWEARQEKDRAEAYFERAVQAAPDDCYVLGSYASFLWDAEEDDDVEAAPAVAAPAAPCDSPALVPAC